MHTISSLVAGGKERKCEMPQRETEFQLCSHSRMDKTVGCQRRSTTVVGIEVENSRPTPPRYQTVNTKRLVP